MKFDRYRWMLLCLMLGSNAFAAQIDTFESFYEKPYANVRQMLLDEGWQIVSNPRIQDSSMVAQGIYDHQYKEVLDCISMERDQCQFVMSKAGKMIIVTTKQKTFQVESIQYIEE